MTDKSLLLDYMKLDRALTPEERRRLHQHGARRARKGNRPSALPGPDGETCGSCGNLVANGQWSKTYFKCGLVNWTHGAATDVRKKDPSCEQWKAKSNG